MDDIYKKSNHREQWQRAGHQRDPRVTPRNLQDCLGDQAEAYDGPSYRSWALYLPVAESELVLREPTVQQDVCDALPRVEEWPEDWTVLL